MTEQPAEPITEQEWLQNQTATARPVDPDELRVRNAQRMAPARLTPPVELRPAPVVAMSRPYELAQANILLRKTITAAAKLQQARRASEKAEEALQAALAAENLAEIDSVEAGRALLEFAREAADQ
jgi:soluble lytic murein transglycosylase-like protein